MLIIADSGSTKTDWRLVPKSGTVQQLRTTGLNPYFHTQESIEKEIQNGLLPTINEKIEALYFYGSGCGTEESKSFLTTAFQKILSPVSINVQDDLLGAARAACGHDQGIVCILGTGSNSALVENGEIVQHTPANGIWLGDEGSAGYLGKQIIIAYLNKELPEELHQQFEKRYSERRPEILEKVYRKPRPNLYLASFSRFVFHNLQHPFCYHLVYEAFLLFFEKTVCKYPDFQNLPVHSVGSVGFYYSNILRKAAIEKEIILKNILETPIAGLALYHDLESK